MSKEIIKCQSIYKSFYQLGKKVDILKGIDASFNEGEVTTILGPSGCGKTTLISIISSFLHPDKGKVLVFGKDLMGMSNKELSDFRREKIGFAFQSFYLIPYLTVSENVQIPLVLKKAVTPENVDHVNATLITLGIYEKTEYFPNQLSIGEQQRVAIARALASKPNILICDEPTSALDQVNAINGLNILKETAKKQNVCVIIVTHDHKVLSFSDKVLKLENGVLEEFIIDENV